MVDLSTVSASVFVHIQGALAIPILKTYAQIRAEVNGNKISFEGKMSFFNGIFEPTVILELRTDMTYFHAKLQDIIFFGGVLILNDIEFLIEAPNNQPLKIKFMADISVLALARFQGCFSVDGNNNGFDMEFSVSGGIENFAMMTVSGSATLDTQKIQASKFNSFDVDLDISLGLETLYNAAKEVVEAFRDGITKSLEKAGKWISNALDDIGNALNGVLSFFKKSLGNLVDDLSKLIGAALDKFVNLLSNVGGSIMNTATTIVNGIGAIIGSISDFFSGKRVIRRKVVRTRNKDKLDCYKLRIDTTYQYTVLRPSWCRCCVWFCFKCFCLKRETKYEIRRSEEYSDVACVEYKKENLQRVVDLSQSSKFYSDSVEKTKKENDAVLSQDLNNLPRPNIKNKISTSIPAAKDATTNFKIEGSAESLDENESKPISQSKPISLGDMNGVKDGLSSLLKNAGEELGTIYKGKMPGADAYLQKLPGDDTEFASDDDYVTSSSFVISSTSLEGEKVFSCLNMKIMLGNLKPEIANYTDEFCGDPSEIDEEIRFVQELTMDHKEFEEPYKNLPFGTVKVLRKYQAKDRCLQESNLVEEIVYVTPEPPKFNYSQTDEIFLTSIIDSFLPYGKLAPTPYSECGYDVDLLLDTDEISLLSTPYEVEKEEECGVWKVSREWSASLNFYDYETFFPSILSLTDTKVEQYFYARDDEKPIFMDDAFQISEVLKIPFHENYVKSDLNAPMAYDISKSFLSTQLKSIKKISH